MKTEISYIEFQNKVTAIAEALGGKFRQSDLDEKAGRIVLAAPFEIFVSLGYCDGRLHFSACLSQLLPDGSKIHAQDYTTWSYAASGREEIKNECSADFTRSSEAISNQVRRMIQTVMPHWDRLTLAYDERVDFMRRTENTLTTIKSMLGNLISKNQNDKGFYVPGIGANVSAWADKVNISGLHTLSLSPSKAEQVIRLLIQEEA